MSLKQKRIHIEKKQQYKEQQKWRPGKNPFISFSTTVVSTWSFSFILIWSNWRLYFYCLSYFLSRETIWHTSIVFNFKHSSIQKKIITGSQSWSWMKIPYLKKKGFPNAIYHIYAAVIPSLAYQQNEWKRNNSNKREEKQ